MDSAPRRCRLKFLCKNGIKQITDVDNMGQWRKTQQSPPDGIVTS
jgi:hypothetical protein